ncbi:MAG: hypothetical protein WBF81_03910, partial [Thermoplasmata archaeon]
MTKDRANEKALPTTKVTQSAEWKRTFDLADLPNDYTERFDRLAKYIEPDAPPGPTARSLEEVIEQFLSWLNEPVNMKRVRDEEAVDPRGSTEQKAQLVIHARLRDAWSNLARMYLNTLRRFNEGERERELNAGTDLFSEVLQRIREHYYLEEEWHYTISALFVMQSWVVRAGALPATFYLYFGGAMSSGKSNILALIGALTDGLMLENVSPSALARMIENGRTLLLDEFDVVRGEELDDVLAAVMRSGYRRNGPPYARWNAKEKQAELLPIFGPKAGAFRSALDPALESRGFVIPTAKPIGEEHYSLVLANLWPKTSDLIPRLRKWGEAAARKWPPESLEELAHTEEFQADLRRVTGAIGANRESELVTIALLVARMVPIDAAASLSSASELRKVEMSEDQAEALDELREAVLSNLSATISFAAGGKEVYRVTQKTVRDSINSRRRERQEKPITPGRVALLRRELGVKDSWLVEPGHRIAWNLPKAFVDSLRT